VTAMMDLALRGDDGPVALASVSERQKISLSYLEQLFGKLRRYSLVDSVRGPGGGYCIARPLDTVTVADIVRAVDEPLDATQCGGRENCLDDHRCMTHDLWAALNAKMYDYLSSVTLAGLVERQRAKEAKTGSAAVIEDRRIGPQPRTRAARDKVAAVA
jgi:Rrf2 family iron-sulfur cluster assembly transcriptional regulator